MNFLRMIATIGILAALSGCAHQITLTNDVSKLPALETAPLDKHVALVITEEQSSTEFTTPGGGGDKVSYRPYRDLEVPIYVALSRVFKDVTKLKSAPDAATMQKEKLDYIVTPTIKTTSSSKSLMTWPPTDFSVTLSCTVADPSGQTVIAPSVTGAGHAEWSDIKHNFSVAGQRATAEAVSKLQETLANSPELRQ